MDITIERNEMVESTKNKNYIDFVAPDLVVFLDNWDKDYKNKLRDIELFNQASVEQWSQEQKMFFVRVLYHLRGHFDSFLWHMGNFAPDYKMKEMILCNIRDEFGKHGMSHEQLFFQFAKSMQVDLTYEYIDETYYLPFAREYIKGQLRWLKDNDWEHRLAGFAAIERLDNADYVNLRDIAVAMGATKTSLVFFNVHINANHFEGILAIAFHDLWKKRPDIVEKVFSFVSDYQISMWRNLSNVVFNYKDI